MKKSLLFPHSPKLNLTINAFFVFTLLLVWFTFFRSGILWWDFEGQWLICRHIIEGVNPYLHTEITPFFVEGLSPVPSDYGTSPWGCITGIVFYPGFLSYQSAQIWFVVLSVLLYVATSVYAFRKVDADKRIYVIMLSFLGAVAYWYSVRRGNAGSMMCLLLFLTVMLKDHHRYLAGLCLAFALVKPQVSLLICLYLLFDKKYITLFVAALINILAYAGVAFILKTDPLLLLKQFFACNIGGGEMYNGIMSLFSPALFDYNTAMYASMVVGTTYAVVMYIVMKDRKHISCWRLSLPFFLATVFWCYSWGSEYVIMLPVCAMFDPVCFPKDIFKRLLFVILVFLCIFVNAIFWRLSPFIDTAYLLQTILFTIITLIFTYLTLNSNNCAINTKLNRF